MTPTPRTDAHQSACLRSGGRSCDGGRNAYWLARQLERENVQMLAVLEDLARYPVAGGYYAGPCIERTDMNEIKAVIALASESDCAADDAADETSI